MVWVGAVALAALGCTPKEPVVPEVIGQRQPSPQEAEDLRAWRGAQELHRQRVIERLEKPEGQRRSTAAMAIGISLLGAGGAVGVATLFAWGFASLLGPNDRVDRDVTIAFGVAGGLVGLGVPLTIFGAQRRDVGLRATSPSAPVRLGLGPGSLRLTF